ncbi:MucR family transcriptional regulator [Komagataeibacter rhaeticus]|nr:MucR family transcriptional regulator [Komagataeibacter rhaeticus]MDT8873471.1 MucR family transcriptional regulator [Komagataeibacter rhaeticus]
MTDHETRSSGADTVRELTTRIVTAYVSSHTVPADTLPGLIATVFQALGNLGQATTGTPDLVPAVPVKNPCSRITSSAWRTEKMKMLKRHLHTVYGLTPQQYRAKWGLPESYPMTAPSYSAQRATLAQEIGLGRTIRATPEPSDVPDAEVPVTRLPEKKRGRRPKLA